MNGLRRRKVSRPVQSVEVFRDRLRSGGRGFGDGGAADGPFSDGGLDGVRPSTSSLRVPVAQSSHPGLKPFCGHFLDAATARGMTGAQLLFNLVINGRVTVGCRNGLFSNHARFDGGLKRAVFWFAMSPVLEPLMP